jgi:membrane protease YdiL (CAAX protease family)
MISLVPGVVEEVAFRGVLQTRLSKILTQKEALLLQAALFSVLHLSPAIFVSHFVMGLLLGWVRMKTGHIYYGMLLHMAWNALVLLQELKVF